MKFRGNTWGHIQLCMLLVLAVALVGNSYYSLMPNLIPKMHLRYIIMIALIPTGLFLFVVYKMYFRAIEEDDAKVN